MLFFSCLDSVRCSGTRGSVQGHPLLIVVGERTRETPPIGIRARVLVWLNVKRKPRDLPARRRRSPPSRISHRFSTEPNPKVRITINRTASMLMYGPPLASSFSAQKPPSATGLDAEFSDRTTGIDGQPTGTARPFPLWRLRSGLCLPPIDPAGHLTVQPLIRFHLLLARSTIA